MTVIFFFLDFKNRPGFLTVNPSFSYHSFQYVEISGFPIPLNISQGLYAFDFSQESISSQFSSDNAMVVKLCRMIESSLAANFLSVPTNSLSRDTRLGWLEPAGVSSLSNIYVSGESRTYRKWLRDIREAQESSGAFSNVAPKIVDENIASPGSGTASIIITYNIYKMTGHIGVIDENYESNKRWIKYVSNSSPDFLFTKNVNNNKGDVASIEETPKEIISTAYFACGALLMSYMAKVLNNQADVDYYTQLHQNISNAFTKAYINEATGKIKGNTQTGYVVALAFKILPEQLVSKAVKHLVDNIEEHDNHLTTGYLGKYINNSHQRKYFVSLLSSGGLNTSGASAPKIMKK